MKKRIARLLVRAVAPGNIFLVLLFSANPALGESPEKKPQHSVKDLKLKVSPNGRYFVDQHDKPFFYLGDTSPKVGMTQSPSALH